MVDTRLLPSEPRRRTTWCQTWGCRLLIVIRHEQCLQFLPRGDDIEYKDKQDDDIDSTEDLDNSIACDAPAECRDEFP